MQEEEGSGSWELLQPAHPCNAEERAALLTATCSQHVSNWTQSDQAAGVGSSVPVGIPTAFVVSNRWTWLGAACCAPPALLAKPQPLSS